ncbi:VOC family protein [Sporosarcina sp. CAU 1771]
MIHKIGEVMLYVDYQDEAVDFWTEKVGFVVISEDDDGQGMRWIEIAPSKEAGTSLVLHNKKLIAEMEPEMNLGTPSLMFFTENLDAFHDTLSNKKVTVGEIITMPSGKVFNFADNEQNYFAVMEMANND